MPLWYGWWKVFVRVAVFRCLGPIPLSCVVFKVQLLEHLLELMRRSWRTTYGVRVIVIVHNNVLRVRQSIVSLESVEKRTNDKFELILEVLGSIDMTKSTAKTARPTR